MGIEKKGEKVEANGETWTPGHLMSWNYTIMHNFYKSGAITAKPHWRAYSLQNGKKLKFSYYRSTMLDIGRGTVYPFFSSPKIKKPRFS